MKEQVYKEIEVISRINREYETVGYSIQKDRVDAIIDFAVNNVNFYKSYRGCSFNELPIINKQTILEKKEAFITPKEVLKEDSYYEKTTSGSSGTPFSFVQDRGCRDKLEASLKYWNREVGISEEDMILHMRSLKQYYNEDSRPDMVLNKEFNILYVDNADMREEKIAEICHQIVDNNIKLVRGYMTSIDAVTEYAYNNGICLHPDGRKIVFLSNGELLSEKVRSRIVNNLEDHVISQYGSEELGVLGMSEMDGPGDKMRFDLANHFFEILKLDSDEPAVSGEIGRIVVTDLSNFAMPFIRYDLGDLAVVGKSFNESVMAVDHLVGRRTDMICRTDGTYLDFFNSCPSSIHNNEEILQWQFIQKEERRYTLILKLRNPHVRGQFNRFIDDLKLLLGSDANIDIEVEENIPVQVSGKRRTIINEYKKR